MTNVYEIGREGRRGERRAIEASDWIAKLDRGLSDSQAEELRHWMQADSENEAELLEMARMWDKMDVLAHLSELFPAPSVPTGQAFFGRSSYRYAISAAVLVAVLGLLAFVGMRERFDQDFEPVVAGHVSTYETAVGGLSKVELPDGSEITLNTDSRVEVIYDKRQRMVKLERGEMHIHVAHESARPLGVLVGRRIVQAIGTAFSVKIDASQRVEVLVADGRVRVGVHGQDLANLDGLEQLELETGRTASSFILAQGERAILDASSQDLELLEPEDVEVQLSWRNGNLIFRGESLADAAVEVSRYTPVEFVFVDENLKNIRVAGLFKSGDETGFLASLEANFDIAYERVDDRTILLSAHKSADEGGAN